MKTTFDTFINDIEEEAKLEGPEAVEQLNILRTFFKDQVKSALFNKTENEVITIHLTTENLIAIGKWCAKWLNDDKEISNEQ